MSTPNRATLLNKLFRVLKRTYKHAPLKGDQPLFEALLFASCLENAHQELAQQAFTKVQDAFFDWNEIRVSTVKELAEVLSSLPEPSEAAARLKGILQSVFESDYSFELEHLKKQNIGAAVKRLRKLQGATPFGVAYATQTALGGHAIPLDKGTFGVLVVLGIASESEAQSGGVPGMERTISKRKGHEFASLLHELGADFFANPFSPALREFLLSISPTAKERFPKRASKKAAAEPPAERAAKPSADGKKKEKSGGARKASAATKKPKSAAKPTTKAAAARPRKKAAKKTAGKTLARRKPR
jgi:hypothetical protein